MLAALFGVTINYKMALKFRAKRLILLWVF
jgi:hypothetical protein